MIHSIELPRKVVIGENAVQEIPKLLESLGDFNSIITIVGQKTYELVGERISNLLINEGYDFDFFFAKNPDYPTTRRAARKAKKSNADVILGVGGGKNIDVAKVVAHELGIGYISIPTIPSHDGIASSQSSISEKRVRYSVKVKPPLAIAADMGYIARAPRVYFKAGCGDVIAKYTAVFDWELARDDVDEYYGEYAAKLSLLAADIIIKNVNKYKEDFLKSSRLLMEALINCGVAICVAGSTRPCSGSEHLFSHSIDTLYSKNKVLHGEKVALGTYIMSYYQDQCYDMIKNTLKAYGLPTNAEEIGILPENIVKALTHAHRVRDRYTILNKLGINEREEARVIKDLKKLEVI